MSAKVQALSGILWVQKAGETEGMNQQMNQGITACNINSLTRYNKRLSDFFQSPGNKAISAVPDDPRCNYYQLSFAANPVNSSSSSSSHRVSVVF